MPDNEKALPLANVHVVVTRPKHQAQGLCTMIEQEGGATSVISVIEIAGPGDPHAVQALIRRLDEFDIAIFVSANAVRAACAMLGARGWPEGVRAAAVGRGSAEALEQHGVRVDILPVDDFNSEGLLAEPGMQQVAGQRVIIFRGEGGRGLLADALRARGAEVVYADVYRRLVPDTAAALRQTAESRPVDAIVVTSNEGLLNLHALAGEQHRAWLLATQLIVISDRAARLAAELGFERPARVAAEASDRGLVEALRCWTVEFRA